MVTFGGQGEIKRPPLKPEERRRLKKWYWLYRSLEPPKPKKPWFKFGR